MGNNPWVEFVKEYRLKNPGMKYSELLKQAAKSPDWQRYKKSNKNKPKVSKSAKILGEEVEEDESVATTSRRATIPPAGSVKKISTKCNSENLRQDNARLKKQMKEMMGMMMKLHYDDEDNEYDEDEE